MYYITNHLCSVWLYVVLVNSKHNIVVVWEKKDNKYPWKSFIFFFFCVCVWWRFCFWRFRFDYYLTRLFILRKWNTNVECNKDRLSKFDNFVRINKNISSHSFRNIDKPSAIAKSRCSHIAHKNLEFLKLQLKFQI